MDSGSSNDDDEPKICTVFSSDSKSTKTIFDTIAFTSPKKEEKSSLFPVVVAGTPTVEKPSSASSTASLFQAPSTSAMAQEIDNTTVPTSTDPGNKLTSGDYPGDFGRGDSDLGTKSEETVEISEEILQKDSSQQPSELLFDAEAITEDLGSLKLESQSSDTKDLFSAPAENSPLPSANVLFADAPEVPFPVGISPFAVPPETPSFVVDNAQATNIPPAPGTTVNKPIPDSFVSVYGSSSNAALDAWIPSEDARKILFTVATGTHVPNVPEGSHSTMPGVIHEVDMVDKVAINMARIFGEAEASRRKILTADNVTQDDNGLRELIKLGCYRSAINLTKRLLTLYGQGPGQVNHFSKHTPHSLQLWYTRIALLVRIREFNLADDEIKAFKDFENPDMFYEYYPEFISKGSKGSIVPFHFRLLTAEIPQYMRRTSDTLDKLTHILAVVEQIISNVSQGFCEDGNPVQIDDERKENSLQIWTKREIRVLYSLANAAIFCKDFNGAVLYLSMLLQKDTEHEMQLKSSIGRLFLQFGDITSAERYFSLAAELSNATSDSDRVDTLVDSGLLAIGQNNYAEALNCFKLALELQPENYMLTNNMAVCLVYLGKVKEALALMESTVKQNTPQLLQENVILNLSTIYELENSDGSKKNSLLKLISEYKGDGINLASLKMPNLV